MRKLIFIKSMLYISSIILLHVVLIYFLKMWVEEWGKSMLIELRMTYILPLLLLSFNCFLCLRKRFLKYLKAWIITSTIPSLFILFSIKVNLDLVKSNNAENMIGVTFPNYYVELVYFFPIFYFIIQNIFLLVLIFKLRKEKNH
ncbi:hypothetical protein B9T62_06245 [Paenibacillus donghaensis]|uniref:Uncharacterized protein n=1 Tax=Paenibacillus donghaensis TaxID=414771 RepID=A0A2Z2KEG7_9BACL|nr:hypothetical protein B9T62_06245 [Paenibacillus donghaensis]